MGPGVIVPRLEVAAQFHVAELAGYYAVDFRRFNRFDVRPAVFVVIGDGHKVDDGNDTRLSPESRFEDVGVPDVLLGSFDARGNRTDAKSSAYVLVQEGSKDAGGIKSGKATPVNGAVSSDKRRR